MDIFSLLMLILAIAVGVFAKLNTGFVAIGMAYVLGVVAQLKAPDVMSGFNVSLFLMLLGVMYMFGVAQTNGTIELLAKKIISLVGNKGFLVPIVLFIVSFFISAIGPGTVPTLAILSVFSVALAKELNMSPVMMASISYFGTSAGGLSPMASTGIIGKGLAEKVGVNGDAALKSFLITCIISMTIVAAVLYIINKGYKQLGEVNLDSKSLPAFNKQQWITLVGMAALVVLVLGFNYNVGLTAFIIGTILLLLRCGEQGKVLGSISWGTLVMVTGVGVLMGVVSKLGGITLFSNALGSVMNKTTAAPLMSVAGSALALFSSQSGVAMPTLISTIPNLVTQVQGVSAQSLISAIVCGSGVAGVSPLTGGALVLSAITTVYGKEKKLDDAYSELLKEAVLLSLIPALLGFVGLYNWF